MDPHDPYAYYYLLTLTVVLISLAVGVAFGLVVYAVLAIGLMRLFAKVGIAPWIAWVPFYSTWKWLELGGQKGWLALLSLIPYGSVVTSVFLYIGMYRTGFAFRKGGEWLVLGIFLPFVWTYLLGRDTESYEPELIARAGFPPPLAGHGSVPA